MKTHAQSHTPGPLRVALETAHTSAEITDEKGRLIASFAVRPYRKRTNADALLFAASPALLAALHEMVIAYHGSHVDPNEEPDPVCRRALEQACAAIELAEGRAQ